MNTLDRIAAALPGKVKAAGSLGELCTYRVGGNATAVVEIDSVGDLEVLYRTVPATMPFLVVGAGSNLLVSDGGFPGIAVRLGDSFAEVEVVDDGDGADVDGVRARVILGGAAMLPRAARKLAAKGVTGFEWAVGVPGTVGGAVRMNAGGHGSDMAAAVTSVSVFNLRTGGPNMWTSADCAFGYRSSAIGPDDVVLYAELALTRSGGTGSDGIGSGGTGSSELAEIVAWRRANQPGGQNAGSVFANPEGHSAGRLIDESGLKGFRIGTAAVSDKHANFIQADPNGSADDVEALIRHIQRVVLERTRIELHVENRLIGFDTDATKGQS